MSKMLIYFERRDKSDFAVFFYKNGEIFGSTALSRPKKGVRNAANKGTERCQFLLAAFRTLLAAFRTLLAAFRTLTGSVPYPYWQHSIPFWQRSVPLLAAFHTLLAAFRTLF